MDKLSLLKQYFGHSGFRPGQEALVDALLSGRDALEFMAAGARAVQVGTANFADALAMPKIIRQMNDWLNAHNIGDVNEIVDTLKLN